ncbi:MAG: beta-propeller fold lactonase family protein [Verrucomicrobiota bacterium]
MPRSIILLPLIVFLVRFTEAAPQHLYLAADNALSQFAIDPDSGALTLVERTELEKAGPFTFSRDGAHLYAMAGSGGSGEVAIATLARAEDGKLTPLHQSPVNQYSGYLDIDATDQFLTGNHYREGKVSLWKLADDGVYRGDLAVELDLEPKAHSAIFSRTNQWIVVPATAPNKVFVNAFDPGNGTLAPNDPPYGISPSEESDAQHPRHLVFHPSLPNIAYTTQESAHPGVCVWTWDEAKGTLSPLQNIATTPEGFEGRLSTADLHATPDGQFLYVSNRHKDGQSSIVGFRIDPESGTLTFLGHNPCEIVPRSFCIDLTGSFAYVAGQIDQKLGVYAIDQNSGSLAKVEQHEVGERPIWVECR